MQLADELPLDDTLLCAFCRRHGIRTLRLFGSAARNERRDASDVDLRTAGDLSPYFRDDIVTTARVLDDTA